MTKKELLEYGSIKQEILQLQRRIAELEKIAESPRGARISAIGHSGIPAEEKKNEDFIIRRERLLEIYGENLAELLERQEKIEKCIEGLSGYERILMRLRYIDGLPWAQVCRRLPYEWAQMHRIHAEILKKIADM